MNGLEVGAGIIFGLLVNEMSDISPWAARKLVRWAAYRWTTDPDVAAGYGEEWTAIIEERPGKLLKLFTAVQFTVGAVGRAAPRAAAVVRKLAVRWLTAIRQDERVRDSFSLASTTVGAASGVTAVISVITDLDDLAAMQLFTGAAGVGVTMVFVFRAYARRWMRNQCMTVRPKRRY